MGQQVYVFLKRQDILYFARKVDAEAFARAGCTSDHTNGRLVILPCTKCNGRNYL